MRQRNQKNENPRLSISKDEESWDSTAKENKEFLTILKRAHTSGVASIISKEEKNNITMNYIEENPTYYETIVKSKIWQEWTKLQEETLDFDIHESIETGWLSDEHWEAFIKWVRQQTLEEAIELVKSNSKGSFTDNAGNDCWYIDELISNLQASKDKN